MESTALLEVVRRVEEAPLQDLVNVNVDDVVVQAEAYSDPDFDSTSFYRRWETQQWAVSDLDFSQDRVQWAAMGEGQQELLRRTMVAFFIGEQAVTDTLSPILHAAPLEDERIFLATQVADEARHTVFFQRFFEEVLGTGGGIRAALESVGTGVTAGYRQIFDQQLVEATDRVRREPGDEEAWVQAVVTYHIVIEGFLAMTAQRNLLRFFRAAGLLPGFTTGFTAVARDESRHIGFGVLALRRRVREKPELGRTVALRCLELSEPAVRTIVAPERRLVGAKPAELPAGTRQNVLELREFAIASLAKRLRTIGLTQSAIGEIEDRYRGLYEQCWSEYERNHGEPHPVRFYQEEAAAARSSAAP